MKLSVPVKMKSKTCSSNQRKVHKEKARNKKQMEQTKQKLECNIEALTS